MWVLFLRDAWYDRGRNTHMTDCCGLELYITSMTARYVDVTLPHQGEVYLPGDRL